MPSSEVSAAARGPSVSIDRRVASDILDKAGTAAARGWTEGVRARLERDGVVAVRISELGFDAATARALAVAVVDDLSAELVAAGLPGDARVEVDRSQVTAVPPGRTTRTLLPHHDGGHCSYLTPSVVHVRDWDPHDRTFSDQDYCTTAAHKLFQGIFVADPGEGRSVTTYYPWVTLVERAYLRAVGPPSSVAAVAGWLGRNISAARRERRQTGARYPVIGACLGSRTRAARAVAPHCAEAELDADDVRRHPEIAAMASACGCDQCPGPAARFLCGVLEETLGFTWAGLRRQCELEVHTQRFDLVVGNNLMLLHGGAGGGPSRRLEPISIVVDEPAGPEYEAWLAREWVRWTAGEAALPAA